jgi:hypothetical protein
VTALFALATPSDRGKIQDLHTVHISFNHACRRGVTGCGSCFMERATDGPTSNVSRGRLQDRVHGQEPDEEHFEGIYG